MILRGRKQSFFLPGESINGAGLLPAAFLDKVGRGAAVVFFENPVKIGHALETAGLADDREGIAALFHLVYGVTEAKLINIFFYGERFRLPDSPVDIALGDSTGFGDIPDGLNRGVVGGNIMNDPLKTGGFIFTDGNLII